MNECNFHSTSPLIISSCLPTMPHRTVWKSWLVIVEHWSYSIIANESKDVLLIYGKQVCYDCWSRAANYTTNYYNNFERCTHTLRNIATLFCIIRSTITIGHGVYNERVFSSLPFPRTKTFREQTQQLIFRPGPRCTNGKHIYSGCTSKT